MENYVGKIKLLYAQFNGKNLDLLDQYYAGDVSFRDPVTQIQGLENLKQYYSHAYQYVNSIEFLFSDIWHADERYCAEWEMKLSAQGLNSGKIFSVHGVSILHFDSQGLIRRHQDYLDLGEMVYEQIPIQGYVIKAIKHRLNVKAAGKL